MFMKLNMSNEYLPLWRLLESEMETASDCSMVLMFRWGREAYNDRVITAGSYWQVLLAGLVAI